MQKYLSKYLNRQNELILSLDKNQLLKSVKEIKKIKKKK